MVLVITTLFSIVCLLVSCILFYETYALKNLQSVNAAISSCKEKITRYGWNYKIRAIMKDTKKEAVIFCSCKNKQGFEIGRDIPVIPVKNTRYAVYAKANRKLTLLAAIIWIILSACMMLPLILCLLFAS
ncbi:MAG: hypothetical protein Q4D94_10315 [Bacillota bacterium]|nr:hypothetical protein [Bacillota bacterium]